MPFILAIDGRASAGKTTLAGFFEKHLRAQIIHADDFFLPPGKRKKRVAGHMDLDGLLRVLKNLSDGKPGVYKPYDCARGAYKKEKKINPCGIIVVEGCYCLHPKISKYYKQKIFADVRKNLQKKRILARGGKTALQIFAAVWLPEEEKYFRKYSPQKICDAVLEIK